MRTETKKWNGVKAKIIVAFGTLGAAAGKLDCSVEGLRGAVRGKCPGIAKRMQKAGLLSH